MTTRTPNENTPPSIETPSVGAPSVKSLTDATAAVPARTKLWMAAIKPPMYTVAVIPIWVGTAAAYAETGILHWRIFLTFLLAAILIIAWLNSSNDVFDADTGIDRNKHHSLVNLTGNRTLVFWLSSLFLMLGITGIGAIATWQHDWTIIGIILLCCALGYSYQGPPFRLGYQGLGEPICFVTFGPLAVTAAYYSQTQSWGASTSLAAAILIGITTSIILFCSHFHQVEDDLAAGKRSPIVRLGTDRGSRWLTAAIIAVFALLIGFAASALLPKTVLLMLLSAPLAQHLSRHVRLHHDQPLQVNNCKFIAVTWHFWSGLLLGLGLILNQLGLAL